MSFSLSLHQTRQRHKVSKVKKNATILDSCSFLPWTKNWNLKLWRDHKISRYKMQFLSSSIFAGNFIFSLLIIEFLDFDFNENIVVWTIWLLFSFLAICSMVVHCWFVVCWIEWFMIITICLNFEIWLLDYWIIF